MDNTIIDIIDVEVAKHIEFGVSVLKVSFKTANQRDDQIEEEWKCKLNCSSNNCEVRCIGFAKARKVNSASLEDPHQPCVYEFISSEIPEALHSEKGFPISVLDGKLEKLNPAYSVGANK